MKFCPRCGNPIGENAVICNNCGTQIIQRYFNNNKDDDPENIAQMTNELNKDTEDCIEFNYEDDNFLYYDSIDDDMDMDLDLTELEEFENYDSSYYRQITKEKKKRLKYEKTQKKNQKKKNNKYSGVYMSSRETGIFVGLVIAIVVVLAIGLGIFYQLDFFDNSSGKASEIYNEYLVGISDDSSIELVTANSINGENIVMDESQEETFGFVGDVETVETAEIRSTQINDAEDRVQVIRFVLSSPETLNFYSRGVTTSVQYEITPESAASSIQWESSDEKIAKVDADGNIQSRRGGECVVTGTVDNKTISVNVNCNFQTDENLLDMNYDDVTLSFEGETVILAIDDDSITELSDIIWESSDDNVATVEDGTVTAVSNGKTTITAHYGDKSASCIVRCDGVTGNRGFNDDASKYEINIDDVTLSRKGEYFQVKLITKEATDSVPEVVWESDDPTIATVDEKGIVTAVSNGTTTVSTTIGGDKFQCIVRVYF